MAALACAALAGVLAVSVPSRAVPQRGATERKELDAELKSARAKLSKPKPDPKPEKSPAIEPGQRALGTGAAFVPGVVLHGAGHYVVGRRRTAGRLLLAEGIGLGMTLVGGAALFLTGASRYLVAPEALVAMSGVGLFGASFLADVYGVTLPDEARGTPARFVPLLETELGYGHVYDPQFEYRNFLVQGLDVRLGRLRIAPSAWFALDDHNARYRLLGGYRLVGPLPRGDDESARGSKDGSRLDLEGAVTDHRFDTEGFRTLTGELMLNGRLDTQRYDESLDGAFVELGAGYALQAFDYDVPGLTLGTDLEHLLLARMGFGVYLGHQATPGGEVTFYYDHRHDGFAAGLILPGLASGIAGHFGLESRYFLGENWGFLAEFQVGSALVGGLSLLYRNRAPR